MKRRVFYVIHLDRNRIFFLVFTFASLILFSFAVGKGIGESQAVQENRLNTIFSYQEQKPKQELETKSLPDKTTAETLVKDSKQDDVKLLAGHNLKDSQAKQPSLTYEPKIRKAKTQPLHLANVTNNKKTVAKVNKNKVKVVRKKIKTKMVTLKQKKPSVQKITASTVVASTNKKTKPKENNRFRFANSNPTNSKRKDRVLTPATSIKKPRPSDKKNVYQLQLGAFRSAGAAQRMVEELVRYGFSSQVNKRGNLHVVQVGKSTSSLGKIKGLEERLRNKDYFPLRVVLKK